MYEGQDCELFGEGEPRGGRLASAILAGRHRLQSSHIERHQEGGHHLLVADLGLFEHEMFLQQDGLLLCDRADAYFSC